MVSFLLVLSSASISGRQNRGMRPIPCGYVEFDPGAWVGPDFLGFWGGYDHVDPCPSLWGEFVSFGLEDSSAFEFGDCDVAVHVFGDWLLEGEAKGEVDEAWDTHGVVVGEDEVGLLRLFGCWGSFQR